MAVLFLGTNLFSQQDSISKNRHKPYILFENTTHDYGTLENGSDGTCIFTFKNAGKSPLIISNCQPSCGCTVADWTKEPIKKNQSGTIKVRYNTTLAGSFQKNITVNSNAMNSPVVIYIKGAVKKAEEKKTNP
jgi:hypothetical protein